MQKRWMMVIDEYEGIKKNAVNALSGYISGLVPYTLPVKLANALTEQDEKEYNLIAVGESKTHPVLSAYEKRGVISSLKEAESYTVYVGKDAKDSEKQVILIAGADEKGVLYGCMDFIGSYCGDVLYQGKDIWKTDCFQAPFTKPLNEWKQSGVPQIKTRALWTWGHVIYDYKAFLWNMARLRLNEIVVWNDFVPINAKDIVEFAHGLGIKVIWGFAWGWGVECVKELEGLVKGCGFEKLKESVVKTYETQYKDTGADGIYFQSFTEMGADTVGGKCVAEVVTSLVNDIAGTLLEKYPSLHIQFGLHATSVKTRLEYLKKVDERVHIVWEDCGAFPYDYDAAKVETFDETYALTENLLSLRGEKEKFGAVFKGMLKLDWTAFEHQGGAYILGERTNAYMQERKVQKDKVWKVLRGEWLKNAEYMRKTVELFAQKGNEPIAQALVEDGLFELGISLPVAIYAQMLWTPSEKIEEIVKKAAKNPFVEND